MNLRPSKLNKYTPQSYDIGQSRTIWKILNRTIYREDEENQWLRNKDSRAELSIKNLTPIQKEVVRNLIEVYGFKYLYSESKFYKTHKISRADFLAKL